MSKNEPDNSIENSWLAEVMEIRRREALAYEMGGAEMIAKHHAGGKKTARERIDLLLDKDSFHEVGALTSSVKYDEKTGEQTEYVTDSFIMGTGRINKRKVMVGADDFTIRGGSSGSRNLDKVIYCERMAYDLLIPMVRLLDSSGGSVTFLLEEGYSYIPRNPAWDVIVDGLGRIPVVSACLGAAAGYSAAKVSYSHFSVMVKDTSQILTAGGPVVAGAFGKFMNKNELGGYLVQQKSGNVDNIAESEEDAIRQIHAFLSYLPNNIYELPPVYYSDDPSDRREEELLSVIPKNPRRTYQARDILSMVFDRDSLFEIGATYGDSTLTFFGRLTGRPVGILASNPLVDGGCMTAESSEKITRFVDMCQTFHVPIVNFVDIPGIMIGLEAESKGTIRKAVRASAAIYQAKVPFVQIIVRRCFGVGGASMSNMHGLNLRYAWPSGKWGSLPLEGGVEAAFRSEMKNAEDPEAYVQEMMEKMRRIQSPFRTAEKFGVEEIIDPRDTRPLLCEWVEAAYNTHLPQLIGPTAFTMRP